MRRRAGILGGLALLLVGSVFGATSIGSVPVPSRAVAAALVDRLPGIGAAPTPTQRAIVRHLRLPRALLAIVGGSLGLSGAVLQGLFRNPMADPGIIGVSSGAAFGAVFAVTSGAAFARPWLLPLCAFLGAASATMAIYRLSTRYGRTPLAALLLAGLAVSAFGVRAEVARHPTTGGLSITVLDAPLDGGATT